MYLVTFHRCRHAAKNMDDKAEPMTVCNGKENPQWPTTWIKCLFTSEVSFKQYK